MSRRFSILLPLCLACLLAGCASPVPEADSQPPRAVVLITVDGLIPAELSVFGGPEATPALERIVERGAGWDDAWTASPMTRPAVTTYLTGVAPDRHRVRDDLFVPFDGSVPTLAELFSEAGYATAAFPDSSFLGYSSGLLDGFEVVSAPPPIPLSSRRWIPEVRGGHSLTADFEAWLESVPAGEPYFAWIHISAPMTAEIWEFVTRLRSNDEVAAKRAARRREQDGSAIARVDQSVARMLDLLEARGDLADALIAVAGTQGSATGDEEANDLVGPGFSIGEMALRVPVLMAFPDGAAPPLTDVAVWSPDVPATIAAAAGLDLAEEAEGIALTRERPDDRLQFAWVFAPRDQMGWHADRAVRSSDLIWVEGEATPEAGEAAGDSSEIARMKRALEDRAEPSAPAVPIDQVRPLLESHGLTLTPVPADGREFGDPAKRRELTTRLLGSRELLRRGRFLVANEILAQLMEEDPAAPGPLLDSGQIATLEGKPEGTEYLRRAVQLYPTDPELLHWYAHALRADSWEDARDLLFLVAPYKPNDADVLYDLACLGSLSDDLDASEDYLRRAIEAGYQDFSHIETDPDLRNLRASGRFSEVMAEYKR